MIPNRRAFTTLVLGTTLALTLSSGASAVAAPRCAINVGPGETYLVDSTTRVSQLNIAEGGQLTAPDGHTLTLTVNGTEKGSVLTGPDRASTIIGAGTYRGRVILTVAPANEITIDPLTFPLRQAIYVSEGEVRDEFSVLAAVRGGRVRDSYAKNIRIASFGEAFNGIYVADGEYRLISPRITMTGNGRSDFAGYGAAVVSDGESSVRVEDARITNVGVVRTPIVATGGSTLVVTDSELSCTDGILPDDYTPTVNLAWMQSVPWMLGATGNCRTTNLLGTGTRASYLNSTITASGGGALSTDTGSDMKLLVANSSVDGGSGYGSYVIGNATEHLLGVQLDAEVYATINRGGLVHYGDASPAQVAEINDALDMGLTPADIASVQPAATTVDSDRFGVMWHGGGSAIIDGATQFNTGEAAFLDKGQAVDIVVDGAQGAAINSGNGVIMQVIEDDDPGPVPPDMTNTGVYTQPTGEITSAGYDIYTLTTGTDTDAQGNTVLSGDAVGSFANIDLVGDFYNGVRGNNPPGASGPGLAGLNMGVELTNSTLTGVITSSVATHNVATITAENYQELGTVTNVASPAVNNGAIVAMSSSTWTLTGTSYLTSLTLDADSVIDGVDDQAVVMTVDGVVTDITPGGSWTGNIALTLS